MPWKQWAYLEKVPSADFQTYLQNQAVSFFTTPTQRDAQIVAPSEGMCCYIASLKTFQVHNGATWESAPQAPRNYSTALSGGPCGAGSTVLATLNVPAQPRAYSLEALASWSAVPSVSGDTWSFSVRVANNPTGISVNRVAGTNVGMTWAISAAQLYPVAANTPVVVTAVIFRVAGTGNLIQDGNSTGLNYLTAHCYV